MNSLCPWPAPSPRTRVLSQSPQKVSEKELQLRGLVFSQLESCVTDVYRGGGDVPYSSTPQASQTYFVDGICTPWNRQQQMISKFLQGGDPDGARVEGDVRGIQQGGEKSFVKESLKVGKVLVHLKLAQAGIPMKWLSKRIYRCDPAVRSVHDELQVALQSGQKFTVMTHSGGGAETAAALAILGSEGYQQQISQQARVLSLASACSPKDFGLAGVKEENLYYTGSNQDPVHKAFREHLTFHNLPFKKALWVNLYKAAKTTEQKSHEIAYLFAANKGPGGIADFLKGAAGGSHIVD